MELFRLAVPPGPGRAFTPTRGSLVVITHVALEVKGSSKPSANPERVTVLVKSAAGEEIALGSLYDGAGREQFSLGGSGLCFGDDTRVVVRHGSATATVCLTGRVEAADGGGDGFSESESDEDANDDEEMDEGSEESEGSESESEEAECMMESESESDGTEEVMKKAARLAKAARRAAAGEAAASEE